MTSALLVGLAGGSGSGKTFFCRALQQKLGRELVSILDVDSYYCDLSHLAAEDRKMQNFDHPKALDIDLLRNHLARLKRGEQVKKPSYDFSTHTRLPESQLFRSSPVVLVEGLMALVSSEVLSFFDLTIYLHVPADIRLTRRMRRDLIERGRSIESILTQYEDSVRPMHRKFIKPLRNKVDLVLDLEKLSLETALQQTLALLKKTMATTDINMPSSR